LSILLLNVGLIFIFLRLSLTKNYNMIVNSKDSKHKEFNGVNVEILATTEKTEPYI